MPDRPPSPAIPAPRPGRGRTTRQFLRAAGLGLALVGSAAASDDALLCERAATLAAQVIGVPADVMRAIALVETGRRAGDALRPWPWAVNMGGQGHWFRTRAEALRFAQAGLSQGIASFDLGCFQINHRWHGQAFPSLNAMLDPVRNARHAAEFLRRLHAETGDWSAAAGAYHSRTPEHAARYRARFDEVRATLAPTPGPIRPATSPPARSEGAAPLLAGASTGQPALGSLVPLAAALPTRLIALE